MRFFVEDVAGDTFARYEMTAMRCARFASMAVTARFDSWHQHVRRRFRIFCFMTAATGEICGAMRGMIESRLRHENLGELYRQDIPLRTFVRFASGNGVAIRAYTTFKDIGRHE